MKNFFFETFSNAINRYLKLDPESEVRLKRLQDKFVTIELRPLGFLFHCHFTQESVHIYPGEAETSITIIRGTPLQLLNVMIHKNERQHFFADDVSIEGDAEIGQHVIELFDAMQIDWEELLSKIVGDIPSYQITHFSRKIRHWLSKTQASITQDINDYIHEEAAWFPAREALQDFFADIDQLRNDVDRLDAKFAALHATLSKKEGSL